MAKTLRNPNRRPTHPGEILREDVLPGLGLTQKEFADRRAACASVDDHFFGAFGRLNAIWGDSPAVQ